MFILFLIVGISGMYNLVEKRVVEKKHGGVCFQEEQGGEKRVGERKMEWSRSRELRNNYILNIVENSLLFFFLSFFAQAHIPPSFLDRICNACNPGWVYIIPSHRKLFSFIIININLYLIFSMAWENLKIVGQIYNVISFIFFPLA